MTRRSAAASALIAVLTTAAPAVCEDAEKCRVKGWDYSYTEIKQGERVIHCRKAKPPDPPKGLDAALELLNKSETARRILDFLKNENIPIQADASRDWQPNAGADFDPKSKTIRLPLGAGQRPALSLAVSIAHEGYHAVQLLKWKMIPCVEAEHDAYFFQNAVYAELMMAGAADLPPDDLLARDFLVFRRHVAKGRIESYEAQVTRLFEYERRRARRHMVLGAPPPLQPIAALLVDSFGWLSNVETLDRQGGHFVNLLEWPARATTRTAHEREANWRQEWVIEHQGKF